MGNAALHRDRLEDEEIAVALAIAEGAGMGAKSAVLEEVRLAEAEAAAAAAAEEAAGAAGGAPPAHAMVAGVLPFPKAEIAAAEGAYRGVRLAVRLLAPAARRLSLASDLLQVHTEAAAGAAAAVRGSVHTAAVNGAGLLAANPQAIAGLVLDKDKVAGAASSGANFSCFKAVLKLPVRSSGSPQSLELSLAQDWVQTANPWGARLPPVLGAFLLLSASAYPHFTSATDWVVLGLYGGLMIVILMLMIGVLAVPFRRSMTPESVSRHAAFVSFMTAIVLLVIVMSTLFSHEGFIIFSSIAGALFAIVIAYLWWASGR